jgi:GrpB-like predicted nucleotidyltransferase (UPF0157 family)
MWSVESHVLVHADDDPGRPAVIAEDGLVNIPAVAVAYDPQWPRQFERLRSQVDIALAGVEHVTVHIGSTAVPGLDAKPIIDLGVVVADQAAVAAAIDALAAAGWQHEGDLGVPGRDAFRPSAGTIYHHLYVVTNGSQAHWKCTTSPAGPDRGIGLAADNEPATSPQD